MKKLVIMMIICCSVLLLSACGSSKYCKSKFIFPEEERASSTKIDLNEDVRKLLEKCKNDPKRAKKYAALVLEIDSRNKEAKAILNRK